MRSFIICLMIVFAAGMAQAQSRQLADIEDCDWRSSLDAIVEPWEAHTARFANGEVRVVMIDAIEPAAAALYLVVISPPYAELGQRSCKVIGYKGAGFSGIDFSSLTSTYDQSAGLQFSIDVKVPNEDLILFLDAQLYFGLDQRVGPYDPQIELSQ
ncbi:MAG: hypothetical protein AAF198_10195 [Pseudomonadota bacterium]